MGGRTFEAMAVLALIFSHAPLRAADAIGVNGLMAAALSGDREAAFRLGRAYKLGDGVPTDARQAERWFEEAVRRGHPKAGAELGLVLVQNGKAAEALPWLKTAAQHGDARAQYALGTLYFSGTAVPVDPALGKSWMRRAAKAGLPAAAEALAIMDKPLPPSPPARGYEIVTLNKPQGAPPPRPVSVWHAQLGAFAQPGNARRYWRDLKPGIAKELRASFRQDGKLTRLRVEPFASKAEVARFCAAQRRLGRDCLEVRGEGDGTAMAVGQKYPLTP